MKKQKYLGVDQTGAVDRNGRPRPLPACVLTDNQIRFHYLSSFTRGSMEMEIGKAAMSALHICVDCVLGLPSSVETSWRSAVQQTQLFAGFGRAPAQAFFRSLGKGETPSRSVELLCKSNSVFAEKPFQKNIQTGTFRIWKDLNTEPGAFYAPHVEERSSSSQLAIFEGYPSLSWKLLLNSRHRDPSALKALLRDYDPMITWTAEHQRQVTRDPNLADALVLALSMKHFGAEAFTRPPHPEGWILGVP